MDYPLNMQLPPPAIGYAVASNEAEHAALTAQGYVPPLEQGEQAAEPVKRGPGRPRKVQE